MSDRRMLSATYGPMRVRLGRAESGEDIWHDFVARDHQTTAGSTGSGKSVSVYNQLAYLATRPDAVVAGLDPTGILLNPFRDHPRSGWRVLGGRDMTGMAEAIEAVVAEMDQRLDWLSCQDLDKISVPTVARPLVEVVLEELASTLALAKADDARNGRRPAERVESRIQDAYTRLVLEGRKALVRVHIITQRAESSTLSGVVRSNTTCVTTFRIDNLDSLKMLHADVDQDVVIKMRTFNPGVGLYEAPGCPLTIFKSDLLQYEDTVDAGTGVMIPGYVTRVRTAAAIHQDVTR